MLSKEVVLVTPDYALGRRLLPVARRIQEEALASLGQTAQLSAIMCRLGNRVAAVTVALHQQKVPPFLYEPPKRRCHVNWRSATAWARMMA
jgi:hypothetical protein